MEKIDNKNKWNAKKTDENENLKKKNKLYPKKWYALEKNEIIEIQLLNKWETWSKKERKNHVIFYWWKKRKWQ